ncbi:MAG TPA: GntR family transcriptional regulator [Aldersonia sp.]
MSESKGDRIYEQLKADILAGALRPGESLSALGIADRFDASRTPVRQAFLRLEAEGLVSLIDRQGARVAPISIQTVRDLFELRILLESTAAAMVAASAARTPAIARDFQAIHDELDTLADQPASEERRTRFYELAEAFDRAVIAHTRNRQLAQAVDDVRPHSARLRSIAHTSPSRLETSLREHQQMCRAIIDADSDAASAVVTEHLNRTQQTILDAVLDPAADVAIDLVRT